MVPAQWPNYAPGASATLTGTFIRGHQIVVKMLENFARLTALIAKSPVQLQHFSAKGRLIG